MHRKRGGEKPPEHIRDEPPDNDLSEICHTHLELQIQIFRFDDPSTLERVPSCSHTAVEAVIATMAATLQQYAAYSSGWNFSAGRA